MSFFKSPYLYFAQGFVPFKLSECISDSTFRPIKKKAKNAQKEKGKKKKN